MSHSWALERIKMGGGTGAPFFTDEATDDFVARNPWWSWTAPPPEAQDALLAKRWTFVQDKGFLWLLLDAKERGNTLSGRLVQVSWSDYVFESLRHLIPS